MNYAIVDIETTGTGGPKGQKITEISVFLHDGTQIIDEFTSLVNPESNIPQFITGLTGIDNSMVADAPKFYEIAKQVHQITEDAVFVAHNVNFDYNIIAAEFESLGGQFKRKKLCTVRLSRKLIPGLNSYSLGKLCKSLDIPLSDRHRARGDAAATVILFEKLLASDDLGAIPQALNPRSLDATLPPLLSKEKVDLLPKQAGVYYFKDEQGKIIYVGKAKNLRARVLSHFYDKKSKEQKMCRQTADVDFKVSGSELLALLQESAEIKHHFPMFNRAQRRTNDSFGLFSYIDQKGIKHLAFASLKQIPKPLMTFANQSACREFLNKLCESYELCPKYCHLQQSNAACFHFQLKSCKGVCCEKESVASYNKRVDACIASIYQEPKTYFITEQGRESSERALVHVENGIYQGYGYLTAEALEHELAEEPSYQGLKQYIEPQKHNKDVMRIIHSYLKNEPPEEQLISFENPPLDLLSLF
ncbi:MAG: exonuclease domain-containing protein [Flavobacteriaceae bacterium]